MYGQAEEIIAIDSFEPNKEFQSLFNELEQGHIKLHERLNSYAQIGSELDARLSAEMDTFETWRRTIMYRLGEISEGFDARQKRIHKRFVQSSVYFRIVQEAPFYWRIMNKPNGYAGDATMMSFIYHNDFKGDTPFGRFLHKHAVSTKACQSVRNRKIYLHDQIKKTDGGHILSLAAGPAQEIKEILNNGTKSSYRFIALDHDLATLKKYKLTSNGSLFTYALANAFQIIAGNYQVARPRSYVEPYCFPRKDFSGLRKILSPLKYELIQLEKEQFDIVYSAGLFDYIKTYHLDDSRGTVALTRNLFELVRPGGSLIVGNFSPNNPQDLKFVMSYIYDWNLFYRDKAELMEFVRSIDPCQIKMVRIIEEPLGINCFLKIEKSGIN